MKSLGTLCSFRTSANCAGNLRASVAAGASGISTGSSVGSETSKATCGFQSKAVAYQLPSAVNRKSVVKGKSVSVRGDLGGRRIIKKKRDDEQKSTRR